MVDVRSTTEFYELIKFSRGHPVRDVDIATNMDIIDTAMENSRVGLIGTATNQSGYSFDGVDDDVSHSADQAGVDFDADDDFYIEMEFTPFDITRTTDYLINKETGGIGYGLYLNEDDLYIRMDDDTVDASAIIGTAVFADNVKAHVFVSFDRSGNATAYVDGEQVGTVDISGVVLTIASAGVMHIGNDSAGTNEFYGEIYKTRIGNTTQTADEARALSNSSPIPYKYVGASQTLIVPSDDCAGDNVANWTDVNGALVHSASIYTYTVTTGASVASFTDEAELTVGKVYKATVMAKDGTGAGATVRINALTNADVVIENGASITVATGNAIAMVEWTATETNNKVQVEILADSVADGETVVFDTITTNSIGCVMRLDPDGIGTTQWTDSSGNALSAVVTGATSINVPSYQNGIMVANGTLASGIADAYAFAWQNPEAVGVLVLRVLTNVTTAGGTGSSVLDVGTAVDATTTGNNLIDGADLNADALYDNITDGGTAGKSRQRMDARGGTTDWITGQILVANASSLVGTYTIEYILVR